MIRLLTIPETGHALGCSRDHVYDLIAKGDLRAVDITAGTRSTKTRIRTDDLEAFIDARTRSARRAS